MIAALSLAQRSITARHMEEIEPGFVNYHQPESFHATVLIRGFAGNIDVQGPTPASAHQMIPDTSRPRDLLLCTPRRSR